MLNVAALQEWVGRSESDDDVASPKPLMRLAALLDHSHPPWRPGELPPLAHWIYFAPVHLQSELDPDGHARRGGFLPPVPLPRRMWVGSRLEFSHPIEIGASMERRSTIAGVTQKSGRRGPLVFVHIRHEIGHGGRTALIEDQQLVYRSAAATRTHAPQPAGRRPSRIAETTRAFLPDAVQLFRFSALTFNSHRIHYDRDYARQVEGYPGLVVQGPLMATLLMDLCLRHCGQRTVRSFEFRAEQPVFDGAPVELCLCAAEAGAELWAVDAAGAVAMSATVGYAV